MGVVQKLDDTLDRTDRHETWRTVALWAAAIVVSFVQVFIVDSIKDMQRQQGEQAVVMARVVQQVTYLEQRLNHFESLNDRH